jgi:cytochrome c553
MGKAVDRNEHESPRAARVAAALACLALLAGCEQQMASQPRYDPLEHSDFFEDGRASRDLVPGTVARGLLNEDEVLRTGRTGGQLVDSFPAEVTPRMLERGRERYNIFCAPCHDRVGTGQGMIVRRGFPPPPSLHSERLRQSPAGYFVEVMTYGYGAMYEYATRIPPEDRWAIAAYIRALQLSQGATLEDVPVEQRQRLVGTAP